MKDVTGIASSNQLFIEKACKDPFYRHTWNVYKDVNILKEAGFFDDGLRLSIRTYAFSNPSWMTTPVEKIQSHLARLSHSASPVVLLSTGAFAPFHLGHLKMMELAKLFLEKQGYAVIGGYLSPSHDQYVSQKEDGLEKLTIAHRLELCEKAICESNWLMTDPWEGYYLPVPVNFTDVILRLEHYLYFHLVSKTPIRVVYVFGSDNAGFARAFLHSHQAICVSRYGFEKQFHHVQRDPNVQTSGHVFFVQNSERETQASSQSIRKGTLSFLPASLSSSFSSYYFKSDQVNYSSKNYLLRDEATKPIHFWFQKREKNQFKKAKKKFVLELTKNFDQAFDKELNIIILHAHQQIKSLSEQGENEVYLSLDTYFQGHYQLQLSRAFAISDGQWNPIALIERPGSLPLDDQLMLIPPGNYTLVDDDSASGYTLNQIKKLLPPFIHIKNSRFLMHYAPFLHTSFLDIVDIRDFLIGSFHGGLVVKLPNQRLARVPYLLPYVSLRSRASIPPLKERQVSLALWQANYHFFSSIYPSLLLRDCHPAFVEFTNYLNFDPTMPIQEWCLWHLKHLGAQMS